MFRMTFSRSRYDAIVVGARCAGAATAMLLARAGAKVLLVDRGARGADTQSTHALMRGAVVQLHRWGLLPAVIAAGTPPVTRTTFHYGTDVMPIDIKPRDGINALYAPRRRVLDGILVDAAVAAGAEIRFGTALESVETNGQGRVRGVRLRDRGEHRVMLAADWVIGADGVGSAVAKQVGADTYVQSAHRTATVYGYFAGIANEGYRWHFRPGLSAGAIPTNDGLHCVFAGVPSDQFRTRFGTDPFDGFLGLLSAADVALATDVYAAGPQDGLHRFGGIRGHLRQSHGPGWALVGDAGYFKDPVTAHGISDALLDAERLAMAVMRGSDRALAEYQAERDQFARPMLSVTDAIAVLDWDLEEVKRLHAVLNHCMKAELAHPPGGALPARQAA